MRTVGLVLLATLWACGGGGGGGDLATPSDLSAPSDLTPTLVSLSITSNPPKILISDKVTFNAFAMYADATMKDVSASATWLSTDTGVATIDAMGTATGTGKGTTQIKASYLGLDSTPVALDVRSVDALVLTWPGSPATPTTTKNGANLQFTATAQLSDASTLDVTSSPAATWTTASPNIVTKVIDGLAYPGMNNGTSDITVGFAGKTATISMLVQ